MRKFREYKEWQQAMSFVEAVYRLSGDFPQDERLGLTGQLRQAAFAIPMRIAEGAGASGDKEFARALTGAIRSAYETATALELAARLKLCPADAGQELIEEADRIADMLSGLRKRVLGIAEHAARDGADYVTTRLNPAKPERRADY